jgi:aminoglycoside phosphotransferase (APT) family kinase protein
MTLDTQILNITLDLAQTLIEDQFPELSHLPIIEVKQQGHDNRTYRIGHDLLIRIPTMECYALAVEKEHKFLPLLAKHLTARIPVPLKLGNPSAVFPFSFSIYEWLEGEPLSSIAGSTEDTQKLAYDLARFLNELQSVDNMNGPAPGQHNWWRGDHISVYDKGAREQIAALKHEIETDKANALWTEASKTEWEKVPVWVHGDFAIGNILMHHNKLSAIIDFGCMGIGDPACDLVIAWTFLEDKAREIFIHELNLNEDTWLRAKAWALWKATFELYHIKDKNNQIAFLQKKIIASVLNEY